MRLWTIHPQYLDAPGLVALWREALLARAVLRGRTAGYRHHPQVQRFHACTLPISSINHYLATVYSEAKTRGYQFDRSKLSRARPVETISVTDGQVQFEWGWLLSKLRRRNPQVYRHHLAISTPELHPLFQMVVGPVAEWEHGREDSAAGGATVTADR